MDAHFFFQKKKDETMSKELKKAIEKANKYQLGQETDYGENEHSLVVEAAQQYLEAQKPVNQSNSTPLEKTSDVQVLVDRVRQCGALLPQNMQVSHQMYCETIRTALTEAQEQKEALEEIKRLAVNAAMGTSRRYELVFGTEYALSQTNGFSNEIVRIVDGLIGREKGKK